MIKRNVTELGFHKKHDLVNFETQSPKVLSANIWHQKLCWWEHCSATLSGGQHKCRQVGQLPWWLWHFNLTVILHWKHRCRSIPLLQCLAGQMFWHLLWQRRDKHFIRPAARSITSISPHCRWSYRSNRQNWSAVSLSGSESALYYTVLIWSLVRSGARGVPLGITLNRNMTGNDKRFAHFWLSVVGRLSVVGIDNNLKWSGCSWRGWSAYHQRKTRSFFRVR